TRRLMDRAAAEAGAQERARLALRGLSPREHEVVLAIARGGTNAEIAAELYMSVPTVKGHITHILTKLQLRHRTQIALLAHDAGLACPGGPLATPGRRRAERGHMRCRARDRRCLVARSGMDVTLPVPALVLTCLTICSASTCTLTLVRWDTRR